MLTIAMKNAIIIIIRVKRCHFKAVKASIQKLVADLKQLEVKCEPKTVGNKM